MLRYAIGVALVVVAAAAVQTRRYYDIICIRFFLLFHNIIGACFKFVMF